MGRGAETLTITELEPETTYGVQLRAHPRHAVNRSGQPSRRCR